MNVLKSDNEKEPEKLCFYDGADDEQGEINM